jgi:hypothetical protein
MGNFAKSNLDYFYANGGHTERFPNLIALEDIKTDTPNPTVVFAKGTPFFLDIPIGSTQGVLVDAEPIVLGKNARYLTPEEIAKIKVERGIDVAVDVAQDVSERALNEVGLVRKSNIAWWLLGGLVAYLIFVKK